MGSSDSWSKKEREKKKEQKKKEKEAKKAERQANSEGGSLNDMIAYVDEYGNITDTPPDPDDKDEIKAEDIVVGVPKKEPGEEPDINREGTVTFFNHEKGFGFIKDAASQESIFTHISRHLEPIDENDRVTFQIEQSDRGPNAVEVKKA